MSVRTTITTVFALGLLTASGLAQSPPAQQRPQDRTVGIEARQRAQMKRIQAGHQRGAIDAAEHKRLLAMERRIQALTERLRASDSKLTPRERVRIQQQLNLADRAIRRAVR